MSGGRDVLEYLNEVVVLLEAIGGRGRDWVVKGFELVSEENACSTSNAGLVVDSKEAVWICSCHGVTTEDHLGSVSSSCWLSNFIVDLWQAGLFRCATSFCGLIILVSFRKLLIKFLGGVRGTWRRI